MADEDRDDGADKGDAAIVTEAKKRFRRCREWEREARERGLEDTKFAEGDSRNGWQWDEKQRSSRTNDGRPALTVNKVRQGVLQIINDQRQNKSQIRIKPVGDGASSAAADVYEGVIRNIEYESNAPEAYDSAAVHQVQAGYGAWRVTTEYADDGSMDQNARIRRVKDPNTVWLDPDCDEFDRSDARFGFVTKDMARDAFRADFPAWADKIPDGRQAFGGEDDAGWHDTDKVRVAEYFRRVEISDTLHHVQVPPGLPWPDGVKQSGAVRESDVPEEHRQVLKIASVRSRPVTKTTVEWYKIAGDQVIDRGIFPGRYIPLVVVIGEETVIGGKLDRKGHVRACLDPQRMFNYYASQDVEFVAGQTKTPWIGEAAAFEGFDAQWSDPGRTRAYLPFNGYDEEGRKVDRPERVEPPVSHQAAGQGMDRAERQLMAASGQYQAQFGEAENAKSGVAINARQRQGDNATYHYVDHMAQAQRHTGRILLGIIPVVYDVERVIKIMAEDGEQSDVILRPGAGAAHQHVAPDQTGQMQQISPQQAQAMQADKALADKVKTIFDPTVGRYDVEADVGPSFGTKRQEAFNAMSQVLSSNKELTNLIGDIYFRNSDWPGAPEIADRMRRMVPPQALGAGPPPELQQAQQHIQGLEAQVAKLLQQIADKGQGERAAEAKAGTDQYRAETDRLGTVGKIDSEALKPVIRGMLSELIGEAIVPVMGQHAVAEQAFGVTQPPTPPSAPGAAAPASGQQTAPQPAAPPQASA